MNTAFQFYIFGPPRLSVGRVAVDLPPQPAAFCAFLVLNRHRRVTREEVQVAFWPDAAPPRAQERLRRTLYLLRRAVEPHDDLIAVEGTELAIAPEANLWVDFDAFEQDRVFPRLEREIVGERIFRPGARGPADLCLIPGAAILYNAVDANTLAYKKS